jgi:hypothetical protein
MSEHDDTGAGATYGEDDNGQLQSEDTLVDRGVEDILDEGYAAPERWSPGEGYGNTIDEQRTGETLDQRFAQEVPEDDDTTWYENVGGEVGDARAGRLISPDEGAHEDQEKDMVADDVGIDGAGASAEEAAIHVIDEDETY